MATTPGIARDPVVTWWRVRFSISLPQLDVDGFDAAGFKDYVVRAEELGFEGGWTLEQTIGAEPLIAPLELLSYAAACTTRLRLGVAVIITSLHDPLQLAATATAVDRLSHGRLDLGVAPGGGFRQFAAFGVEPKTFISASPRARADEGRVVRRGAGDVSRPIPRRRRPADPAEARAASAPADLVRRHRTRGAGPRGPPRRRVPGRRLVDDRDVRRGGRHGAPRTRGPGQGCRGSRSASAST